MKHGVRLWILGSCMAILAAGVAFGPVALAPGEDRSPSVGRPGAREGPRNLTARGKKGGPPPHAPAHGYRAKYQYRYYPCCRVYHDVARGVWFYIKAGDWAFGASLPANLQAELGQYVNISLDTERPFEFNEEHKRQFPPEQFKKGK